VIFSGFEFVQKDTRHRIEILDSRFHGNDRGSGWGYLTLSSIGEKVVLLKAGIYETRF